MPSLPRRREGLAFCTLGMFIIDEIEDDHRGSSQGIMGGAGTYASLGARLVAGRGNARLVSWIVDMGSDFPVEFQKMIETWETDCHFRLDTGRLTTRGWNGYGRNELRAFKYMTPKLRLDEYALTNEQVLARSFHLVCSSQRCVSLVTGILARRQKVAKGKSFEGMTPTFVWEPVPDLCNPSELESFQQALKYIDIVSPNAEELAGFFQSESQSQSQEDIARQVLSWGIGSEGNGVLVVREGANGCRVYAKSWSCHLPAYYQCAESSEVIDPTGAGNTFLGALAMKMADGGSSGFPQETLRSLDTHLSESEQATAEQIIEASCFATIAASYAIQQIGMPRLTSSFENGEEWNGQSFAQRLAIYFAREKGRINIEPASEKL